MKHKLHRDEDVISREDEAFNLRVRGWSQLKIAQHLGMTQQGVSKALKRGTKRFTQAYLENMKQVKEEQVTQLEHVANEAIDAWYESKKPRKSMRTKVKGAKDSKRREGEKIETEEFQYGDPRYLAEFRKAKADIREILGLKYIEPEDDEPPLGEIRINIVRPELPPDDDSDDD